MSRYLSVSEFLAMFPGDALVQALGTTRDATGRVSLADPSTLEARVALFIGQAEDEADAYISTQYVLPLKSVPPVVKPFIADLTRHRIYSEKTTVQITGRRDEAISFFNKVSRGDVMLGVPDQMNSVAASSRLPLVSPPSVSCGRLAGSLADWSRSFTGGY